ncbi:MAG: glutathione S-transferase N-terminal domain-containing protein [Deltaproteobacteria bacterium]|jgi:glutathione S-transferase|nr:glutathione S-transferase N-terminal domain-containing protein [Deltaproteobacteria bacterium]
MGEQAEDSSRPEGAGAELLSLYGYPQCPFCQRVLRAIEALGLEVELRNTLLEPERRDELIAALGRGTVPVLRIEDAGEGDVEWLPESAEIVSYLEERFGSS